MNRQPTVSIVMIFLNAERFIEEAIASIYAQTSEDWELILVDDGSTDGSARQAQAHAVSDPGRIRYVEHEGHRNHGMSPSRNLGVRYARGKLVAFLDSDDTWTQAKLQEQIAILAEHPDASMVYGTPRYWSGWTGLAPDIERDHIPGLGFPGDALFQPPDLLFLTAPLGAGPVPCPSDVMVRADAISRVGGFERIFRGAYEDVAFFVKIFMHEPVFVTSRCWTNYRIHPESCMATTVRDGRYQSTRLFFLNWYEQYLAANAGRGTAAWTELQSKLAPYRHALRASAAPPDVSALFLSAAPNPVPVDSMTTTISWDTGDGSVGQVCVVEDGGHETLFAEGASGAQQAPWISAGGTYEFRLYSDADRSRLLASTTVTRFVDPGVGGESFGSLRRLVPVSRTFGFDRGKPVDRHYIEAFLKRNAGDIRGRVLEVGESTYTRRFGGPSVSAIDVLHVTEGNPEATIVGDLSDGAAIPSNAFDCILLIQTLHLIFDAASAVETLHRILKPGGVVLATFPGISPRSHDQWGDSWYWGFTSLSARRLFERVFPAGGVTVHTYGNVLASAAFLFGLASAELTPAELDHVDPSYEMLVAVQAVKTGAAD